MENQLNCDLPSLSANIARDLMELPTFLRSIIGRGVLEVRLYGSYRRGEATCKSDIDIIVILDRNSVWLTSRIKLIRRIAIYRYFRWMRKIEKRVNMRFGRGRLYSIKFVTPEILRTYLYNGPIYLQNLARAIKGGYVL